MDTDNVICEARHKCREASMCGGAKPHRYDPNECGKCGFIAGFQCVPVTKEDEQ